MAARLTETLIKSWTPKIDRTSKGSATKHRSGKPRKRRKAKRIEESRERGRWTGKRLAVIGVVAAGAVVAAALLFLGGIPSMDQQTTQTTSTTVKHIGGDVFKLRVFGVADPPDEDEWWLAFNVTMTPSEEWRDVAVSPEVFFAQLSDMRYVAGQGVRGSMTLMKAGDAVSVSKKDEFPTTRVQPGETVSGLVLFLLPGDSSIARLFFHNGEVTADLPQPPI